MMRQTATECGDQRGIKKFSVESEEAKACMDDLKARVKDTQDQVSSLFV